MATRLWDPASGSCLACLWRRSAVRTVAASGLLLAIGDDDGISVIELDPNAVPGLGRRGRTARWRRSRRAR